MRPAWKLLLLAAGLLAAGAVAAPLITVTNMGFTCVLCRSFRAETTCLGITIQRVSDSDCSRWYASNVEPEHDHIWERNVCVSETNLFGYPRRLGCSPGRFPIWRLDPDVQLGVYQHFKNPIEAKEIFAGLMDAKIRTDDDEYKLHSKEDLIIRATTAWAEAGFPGTWDAYWDRMCAASTEENKEYRSWMKSDSNMNFYDWKARKNQPPEHP